MSSSERQRALVLEQFAQRAEAFATAPAIANEEALRLLVTLSEASSRDTVLDVACGAGLVVCAFAEAVQAAVGIDLTPAMIDRARALQLQKGLQNVTWRVGDVLPLPFPTGSFSIVTSRYAFHHFENPAAVLAEMKRVCQPDGKIVLADVQASADPENASALNRMEKLRDPSHVRAMPLAELEFMLGAADLKVTRRAFYSIEFDLEQVLQGSSPNPGDAEKVRQLFAEELTRPRMDLRARRVGDAIRFAYPIMVLVAENHSPVAGRPLGSTTASEPLA